MLINIIRKKNITDLHIAPSIVSPSIKAELNKNTLIAREKQQLTFNKLCVGSLVFIVANMVSIENGSFIYLFLGFASLLFGITYDTFILKNVEPILVFDL